MRRGSGSEGGGERHSSGAGSKERPYRPYLGRLWGGRGDRPSHLEPTSYAFKQKGAPAFRPTRLLYLR